MKLLVVGASGFVGWHTLSLAKSLKWEVIGTGNNNLKTGLVLFNLNQDQIKKCINVSNKPDFCLICSSVCRIDQCFKEKKSSYRINVKNTIRLITDLIEIGVKPIFLSSDNVFDGVKGNYNEEDKVSPVNEYGRQKAEVENYILKNIPNGLILRLSKNVGNNPLERHLFSEWQSLVESKKKIVCIEGQAFSPTLVNDVAKGILLSCEKDLNGLYNLSNQESFTRIDLAKQFISQTDKKADIINRSLKSFNFLDHRPLKTDLNPYKFIKATGITFTTMNLAIEHFLKMNQKVS